jgi:hypothetical protein
MKEYYQEHVPFGFVVHPVGDYQVRNKAYQKIDRIDNARFSDHILIIAFHKGKGHVPESPDKAEDEASCEETALLPDTVNAIRVPAEFFQHRGKKEQKPGGKNPRGKGKTLNQLKLGSAVPEKQRHRLGQQYAGGGQQKGHSPPPGVYSLKTQTGGL